MNPGFYKKDNQLLLYAPLAVQHKDYVLLASKRNEYEYPIHGWTWYDSEAAAYAAEGLEVPLNSTSEIISELSSLPDWGGLINALTDSQLLLAYMNLKERGPLLLSRLNGLRDGSVLFEGSDDSLLSIWNFDLVEFDEPTVNAINQAFEMNNVPLKLSSDGTLSVA